MIQRFARPYAEALLQTVDGLDAAKAARDELGAYCEAQELVPALKRMAASPTLPLDVKMKAVAEVAAALGISPAVTHFIELLLNHYRLQHVASILEAVDEILKRRLGVVTAHVTSAEPLGDADRERLVSTLSSLLDQTVEVEVEVDPELLGGFVALVGSRRYDASLRGQLERLAESLATSAPAGSGARGASQP